MKFSEIGPLIHRVMKQDPASRPEVRFDYIDLSSINRLSKAIESPANLPTVEAPSRARQLVQTDDVLVSTVRPNLNAVARVPPELDGATASTGFTVLRAKADQLDPAYLIHWVRSDRFVKQMVGLATGASYPAVTDKIVKKSLIPLVPLVEQRRIASILDAADQLRTKRQQAIDRLGTLTQAIFHDMFGDPKSTSPEHPLVSIGELARNEDSIRVPVKASDRKAMAGEYPYYGASGVIDHVDSYLFEGRRLLVAEDGANLVARSSPIAFLAEGRYWVNNHAHVLADNGRANLVYLREVLEGLDLTASVTGSAQPKLNRKNLDLIRVPEPPRSRQDEYEDRVTCVAEIQERSVSSQFEVFDDLFASLQQRAFRGDL